MREQWQAMRLVLRLAAAADRRLTWAMFPFALGNAAIWAGFTLVMRGAVDAVTRGDAGAAVPFGIAIGVLMAAWPQWWRTKAAMDTALHERTSRELDRRLIDDAIRSPGLALHEDPEYQDRLMLMRAQTRYLGDPAVIGALFSELSMLAVSVVLLATVNPICALLPLFAIPSVLFARRGEQRRVEAEAEVVAAQRLRQRLFSLLTDPATAKETVVLGLGEELRARHRAAWRKSLRGGERADLRDAVLTSAGWVILALGLLGTLWLLVWRASHGEVSAGDVMLFLLISQALAEQLRNALYAVTDLLRALSAAQHFRSVREIARRTHERAGRGPAAPVPARIAHGMSLEQVTFTYPGQTAPALCDVSLQLPAGSTIALVGENGAGKTTLVKLLCRLYEPTHGVVALDGHDVSAFDLEQWRTRCSAGFQDFVRFELLLRESVGVGDLPRLDDETSVRNALQEAGAESIGRHAQGRETQLGGRWSGGIELSGGQWQRVALARAFMRQTPLLLVLDEPTASLDAATEHQIFARFAATARAVAAEGSITLFVSHRLSTVRAADLIVFLEDGRIAEHGSHQDLLRAGGRYAELYALQLRAYEVDPALDG